jgi:UDP-2-acetamido-2,6-beta-L-arabino-hexul-4-ose reductase
MKILLTGASGFLGWHTRVRLRALTAHEVVPVTRKNWAELPTLMADADAVIQVAGVNRGAPADVETGNVQLAQDLAGAIRRGAEHPVRVIFANSIQSGSGTPYGVGKARAAELLAEAAASTGGQFVDVLLPNLFGECGRPAYNSFVATFVDAVARGKSPSVQDREVALLHVQEAAQTLIDAQQTDADRIEPSGTPTTVLDVLNTLREFRDIYADGDIPSLETKLRVDLFNTFRAALFPRHYPLVLRSHVDERGRLLETVRAHGGQGQTFVSTTRPGVTRGEHFHLSKVERFVVLSGRANISLRKVFDDQIVAFDVSGDLPCVVDMPTMWVHNITNTGESELTTLFWTHTLFDPDNPDTFREPVSAPPPGVNA